MKHSAIRLAALVGPFALLLAACGNGAMQATPESDGAVVADGATPDAAPSACVAVARTCAEVTAAFASNSGNSNVSVTCDDAAGTFTLRSTGVPNYDSNQTTPNAIRDQGWVVVFPLSPTCAATATDVVASRGELGFMVNGVPFYGPQDADGRDAVQFEGPTFDDCEGHADQSCSYHYHEEPLCVFGVHDTAAQHRLPDGHPPVVGYALDGFAIYASYGSAAAPAGLDGCQGHVDATRGYHYHATSSSPYLVGCFRGARAAQVMRTMNLCATGMTPQGDAGTMGPRACTSASDCTGACPQGSAGCTCAAGMASQMICVPTCTADGDCPTGGAMQLRCDTARQVCVPQ